MHNLFVVASELGKTVEEIMTTMSTAEYAGWVAFIRKRSER